MKQPKNRIIVISKGKECPKCKELMERRKHCEIPKTKTYFYTEWDYCKKCNHVQHYEEFKSSMWKEEERQQSFLRSI